MSSPYKIHITPDNTGLLKVSQTEEAAEKASFLLQQDLEKHHVFFNQDGFHNHIPHHILALYGTGAPASSLQAAFDHNTTYQRPVMPSHENNSSSSSSSPSTSSPKKVFFKSFTNAKEYLGKEAYYPDFLRFFQDELNSRPEEDVLHEYLFSPAAEDKDAKMLVRLFAGLLHPLIQLMYGVEFHQRGIIAEALAQTAVHGGASSEKLGGYLLEAEKRATNSSSSSSSSLEKGKDKVAIIDLIEEIRNNESLRNAARRPRSAGQMYDSVLGREEVKDALVKIASRVRVHPEEKEIERRTVEMVNTALYVASSGAFCGERIGKIHKFDFGLIHHVNASPIFLTLNSKPWLTLEIKARLLEWKIRMDLLQYVVRGCPALCLDKISGYKPKDTLGESDPLKLISRLHDFEDDGHAIKLGRAAIICKEITTSFIEKNGMDERTKLPISTDDVFNKIFHLILDSVEAPGPNWVMNCGLDEAWEDVPDAASS
ncbi:HypA protein [Naviculisporaceae sp. PSN 640]